MARTLVVMPLCLALLALHGSAAGKAPVSSESVSPPPPVYSPDSSTRTEAATAGTVTIRGVLNFYDRDGHTRPQRQNLVELLTAVQAGAPKIHVAWTYTNSYGHYEFPPLGNPGAGYFYIRVYTYVDYGDGMIVVLVPGGTGVSNCYFREPSWGMWHPDLTVVNIDPITTPNITDEDRKAWWIKDEMMDAYTFVPNPTGRHVVEWSPSSLHGNHYHPGGNIQLTGQAADYKDVILKNMGLSVLYNINGVLYTPFCNTECVMATSNEYCAWAEGWAWAWAAWTQNDQWIHHPECEINTHLEIGAWGDGDDEGASVGGRVAAALWDLTDTVNDGTDTCSVPFSDIWDVVYNVTCNTFADFWAAWKARGHPTHLPVAAIYQNTIDYDTPPSFSGLPNKTVNEDANLDNAIDLFSYASDPESTDGELSFSITGNTNSNCGVSIDGDRYIDIRPTHNWYGASTVTVRCSDGVHHASDSFVVTVNPVPDAPIISLGDRSTDEDIAVDNAVDLWGSTYDPETPSSGLTYAITANTNTNCLVTLDSNHYLDIKPVHNWNGYADVTVRATDPGGLWGEDTFRITVYPVNDAPSVSGLPDRSTDEDTPYDNAINLWNYTLDSDNPVSEQTYTITANTNPLCGVSVDSNHYIDISPAANWYGVSDVTVRVTDPGGLWDEDTVRITVNSVNDTPTLRSLPDQLVAADTPKNDAINLLAFAVDDEAPGELIYEIVGNTNANCQVDVDAGDCVDISPTPGWTGYSDVTVRATDAGGLWDQDTFRVVVANPFDKISLARANLDGTWVMLTGKVTTGFFDASYYIEERDRSSGIRISTTNKLNAGREVTVAGPLSTASQVERQITPYYQHVRDDHIPIRPLSMSNDRLGGASPDPNTPALPNGGTGLYNVGLLVRTTGRVIEYGTVGRFYITDGGSVVDNASGVASLLVDAVPSGYQPPVGSYVSVTGISAAMKTGMRVLRPRDDSDITIHSLNVAYIYEKSTADANSFKNWLDANGLLTTLISMGALPSTDLSGYHVILIGRDTGTWSDPTLVTKVLDTGTPVIAIGLGGACFLDAVTTPDLRLGLANSRLVTNASNAFVYGGDIYSYPYRFTVSPDDMLTLFTVPGTDAQSLEDQYGRTDRILREDNDKYHFPVACEQGRFYQWGFYGSPDTMTDLGRQLFTNLVFSTVR